MTCPRCKQPMKGFGDEEAGPLFWCERCGFYYSEPRRLGWFRRLIALLFKRRQRT